MIKDWEDKIFTDWHFDDLPGKIPLYSQNKEITGYLYPSISPVYAKGTFIVSFIRNKDEADDISKSGFRYYLRLLYSTHFKQLKKQISTTLSGPSSLWFIQMFSSKADAVTTLIDYIVDTIFKDLFPTTFNKKLLQEKISSIEPKRIYKEGKDILDKIMSLIRVRREVLNEIERHKNLSQKSNSYKEEIFLEYNRLLTEILPHDFFTSSHFSSFDDNERFLKSLMVRISRAHSDLIKDGIKAEKVNVFTRQIDKLEKKEDILSDYCAEKIILFKYMIQEYRVSLFSPELKTKTPVSEKKLRALWRDICENC